MSKVLLLFVGQEGGGGRECKRGLYMDFKRSSSRQLAKLVLKRSFRLVLQLTSSEVHVRKTG